MNELKHAPNDKISVAILFNDSNRPHLLEEGTFLKESEHSIIIYLYKIITIYEALRIYSLHEIGRGLSGPGIGLFFPRIFKNREGQLI